MRGEDDGRDFMFSYISPERRVPADHPLRPVKAFADDILKGMSKTFDAITVTQDGRRSRRSGFSRV